MLNVREEARPVALEAPPEEPRWRWKDLLDLECAMPDDERQREIGMFLAEDVIPFLERIGTEDGLRSAFTQGRLTQALMVDLRRYLGGSESLST